MALITVGTTALPNPSEYSVSRADLDSDNTGRTESGVLHRDRVRAGVYKIQAKFNVTKAELKTITDAVAAASFAVTFFDPTTSSDPTKTMYVGDRAARLSKYVDEAAPADSYWELTLDLIEF